jgi:hypothetical protein
MKIGIVSYWFNRGQAVVSRHLRSLLESQGHETYVLARLTRKSILNPFMLIMKMFGTKIELLQAVLTIFQLMNMWHGLIKRVLT